MRYANVFKTFLVVLTLLCFTVPAFGAWTTSSAWRPNMDFHIGILAITWTEDASASGDESMTTPNIDGHVYMVVTDPGSPAPDAYDLTLKDSDGADIMEGAIVNASATATEQWATTIGGSPMGRFVKGTLTVNMTNQATNSASGTIIIYIYRE